jgi:gliding motility-associated-like protein
MTRKRLTAVLAFILLLGTANAQTTTSFRKDYNISLFDLPINSIEGLTPNTYVFAGFHAFNSTITAVDNVGVTTWSKRFSSGISLYIGDLKKDVSLNRYYVCGGVDSGPAFLLFLDASGNLISGRNFSISQATGASFNRVIKTADGGYLCVGTVTGYDPDGAGPEVQFSPVTHNPPECSSSQTEWIQSPLIVKFDASGNHVWHQVFRYYVTSNTPANRIYNDASFVDVVEISDGYIAIGSYDVNNVFSSYDTSDGSSCGEDRTPTDAMIAKFSFAGAIQYHRQIDSPSNSTTQPSKSFSSASLTAAGLPLISAADGDGGRPMALMRFTGSGGWAAPTWISRYGASSFTFFFTTTYNPFQPGRFFETSDGNYAMWGFHINSLSFEWSNVLMKINTTGAIQWSRQYTNEAAVILPHGEQSADGGYIGVSYTLAGSGHNLHLMKTDPLGNMSVACPETNVSVTQQTPSYTWGTPIYNAWNANTVTNGVFTPTVANITPTETTQCLTVIAACTLPTISTQPSNVTICSTGTANVSVAASAGPYQWQYNNGGTWANVANGTPAGFSYTNATTNNMTINTSGAAQGTYQFRVVVGDVGCQTISEIITVTVPGATRLAPTGPQCSGTQLNFEAFPTTGATYAWTVTPPGGTSATPASGNGQTFSFVPTNTTSSSVTFPVSVDITHNGVTCTVNFNPTILPTPAAPSATVTTQPTCAITTGTITATAPVLGANEVYEVTGTAPVVAAVNNTTGSFAGLTPGTYDVTVLNTLTGCESSAVSLTVNAAPGAPTDPSATVTTQPTCAVPTGTIEVAAPLGGQYTYSIDGTTFQAGTTFSGLAPGSYTITVLDNTSGCSSVSASTITIDPVANAPVVTLVSSTAVTCNGGNDGELEISISGGAAPYTLVWNPNVGNTTTLENLAAGSYSVNVTDDAGCSTSATFTVGSPNALLVNGTSTNVLCGIADGTITTAVTGGTAPYTFVWTPNGETSTSLSGLAAGTYSVLVTDDNGCTANQNFTLTTIGNLPVDIDPSYVEIEAGESVVLTATGGDNYVWTPTTGLSCTTCPNPTANPTVTTTYYVSASDDNGCVGGDSSLVVIKLACGDLFVPTIFSPNGTGPDANNKLCVFGTASCIEELKFQVFNRWGEVVFETTDIENCWDGNYKDKPANSGIFVYRLYVKLYNNDEPIDISGNTTLVR